MARRFRAIGEIILEPANSTARRVSKSLTCGAAIAFYGVTWLIPVLVIATIGQDRRWPDSGAPGNDTDAHSAPMSGSPQANAPAHSEGESRAQPAEMGGHPSFHALPF